MRFSGRGLGRWLQVAAVLACLVFPSPRNAAADDPAAELKQTEERQREVQAKLSEAKDDLNRVYWQREQVKLSLQITEREMFLAQSKQALLDEQRKASQAVFAKLDASVKETQARLDSRKDQLGSRLRAIQTRGRVSYFGVLLGSNSYGDFLSRMEALKTIIKHDVELMGVIRADKAKLETERETAAAEERRLKSLQNQVAEQAAIAETKRAEYKRNDVALNQQQALLEEQVARWEKEYEQLGEQIWEIQRRMARQGGKFAPIEPLKGQPPITEVFGLGPDPIVGGTRNHGGTDFGAPMGTPVYAIEDGVVIARRWDSVYGNLLVIDHGGGVSSWYAHMSAYTVADGAEVKQGQQVGRVGSTGYSTGPHLHLEIRVNNVKKDPMSYFGR